MSHARLIIDLLDEKYRPTSVEEDVGLKSKIINYIDQELDKIAALIDKSFTYPAFLTIQIALFTSDEVIRQLSEHLKQKESSDYQPVRASLERVSKKSLDLRCNSLFGAPVVGGNQEPDRTHLPQRKLESKL